MELLYENASEPPGRRRARLSRRADHATPSWSTGSSASPPASPPRASAPATPSRLLLPNDPDLRRQLLRDLGARRRWSCRSTPPSSRTSSSSTSASAGVRAVISDDRSAGVCERIVAGWDEPVEVIATSAAPRPGAHARHADRAPSRPSGSSARSPDEPLVYHVLLRLDRPAQARGPHARPAARRGRSYYAGDGHRPRRPDLLHDPAVPHLRHGLLHVRGDRAPAPRS